MSESDRLPAERNAELARSLCQQAALLHEQADYAAAQVLYERALAIQEEAIGKEHPDTARSLHGLAQVQMKQGQEALARPLLEKALMIQEEMLGPEHPDTATSLHTLGELESNLGDLETGLDLMARAYIIRQTKRRTCACDVRNPSGQCCLKNFPRAAESATSGHFPAGKHGLESNNRQGEQ